MGATLEFLLRHGYAVVFATVLGEQLGIPIPATPVLLAMGALAGAGHFSFGLALALAAFASLLSDAVWYGLGRYRGQTILSLLCRISLEPDYCITRTKNIFGRYGQRGLLIAKFVPGFSTAAPPMAGLTRMPLTRFLVLDGLGSLLWAGAFLFLGLVFRHQLEWFASMLLHLGKSLGILLAVALVCYGVLLMYQRRKFLRSLRMARVTPEVVRSWLDAQEPVLILDLRHESDVVAQPMRLPGALRITQEELEARHQEIPRDREIVLYCS